MNGKLVVAVRVVLTAFGWASRRRSCWVSKSERYGSAHGYVWSLSMTRDAPPFSRTMVLQDRGLFERETVPSSRNVSEPMRACGMRAMERMMRAKPRKRFRRLTVSWRLASHVSDSIRPRVGSIYSRRRCPFWRAEGAGGSRIRT